MTKHTYEITAFAGFDETTIQLELTNEEAQLLKRIEAMMHTTEAYYGRPSIVIEPAVGNGTSMNEKHTAMIVCKHCDGRGTICAKIATCDDEFDPMAPGHYTQAIISAYAKTQNESP